MALQSHPAADPADGLPALPELRDADYLREVLGYDGDATEADVEQEMMVKAAALGVELPVSRRPDTQDDPSTPTGESAHTLVLQHGRTVSSASDETAATALTLQTSNHSIAVPATATEVSSRRRSRSLTFTQYEKYLSQVDPALDQPKFLRPNQDKAERSAGIVMRSGTRRRVRGLTQSLANRLRKRRSAQASSLTPMPCICCREDFTRENNALQTLPCGHTYCRDCLAVMIAQSTTDESKMPPRCCTQPIPSSTIKAVLPRDKQQLFLKAVVQYGTPWERRIFCPNLACGEFIPPANRVDPKHPFEALCKSCKTRVCVMCKRPAHLLGHDCPDDRELDAVLRMGEKSGWRRCYKCRTLVELMQGCTHITCRCKAQFCYICGAVWDPAVGCPNFCNGEEELERRRAEEEARLAELEAEKLALEKAAEEEEVERREAERRTRESEEFRALRKAQEREMERFTEFESRAKEAMRARQSEKKSALVERFSDLMEKMRERHAKTEQHLEDRQVLAEIELQAGLEEKEKKVRLKLRYMEDYCHGRRNSRDDAAPAPATGGASDDMPPRQVTPKDLEQLRQQYCVRDGMERRHQSQINGLREKQAKSMEELVERHEKEMQTLSERRREEIEDLAVEFTNEEEALLQVFGARRARMERRWLLAAEILRAEMERKTGKRFARMRVPRWVPDGSGADTGKEDHVLADVFEEEEDDEDEEQEEAPANQVPVDVGGRGRGRGAGDG
ncbi:hypothetical protein MFIFM68171_01949 [Madurella fahalii]|uniref:RBR-type E3 ubiquitin transferase n=1 Tax=Madurella fahalii TaxID=1157608 RepID=A0ABQ0G1X0_9PEZI